MLTRHESGASSLTLPRVAELLNSIPAADDDEPEDSQMNEIQHDGVPPIVVTGNLDPEEAQLEAREINKYLMAKSFFDCREFDRCAAVFLPDTVLSGILSSTTPKAPQNGNAQKMTSSSIAGPRLPKLSQKSLFLALYAKFMSGEKKKDEDTEMVMGPQDGGSTINKQLIVICRLLESWFAEKTDEVCQIIPSNLGHLQGAEL